MNNELEWEVITDPEKLFHLHKAEWEIQIQSDAGNDKYCPFKEWDGRHWNTGYLFRGRPPKPKMRRVKMECFSINGELRWRDEKLSILDGWLRQPHLDKIAEVPE